MPRRARGGSGVDRGEKIMKKIHCLNNISKCGTDRLPQDYVMTDSLAEAEGVLVLSLIHI